MAPLPPPSRAARGRRHAHRLDRVLARPDRREEGVARLVERVVVADAVQGDVQERLGQAVDRRRAARDACLVDAHQIRHRVQHVARRRRDRGNLVDVERGGHCWSLCVDELRAGAGHGHALLQPSDLEDRADVGRNARLHPHVVDDGGLEPHQRDAHAVDARIERGHGERAGAARRGIELRAGGLVRHDHGSAGNHTSVRIDGSAGDR
jgi:hypothetical protein